MSTIDLTKKFPREMVREQVKFDEESEPFIVIINPRAYGFTEQIYWADRLKAFVAGANGNASVAITEESAQAMLEWAAGAIVGFEGLADGYDADGNPIPLEATPEKLNEYPELLALVFEKVVGAAQVKKTSPTP